MIKKITRISLVFVLGLLFAGELAAQGSIYSLQGQGILFHYHGSRATGMGGATLSLGHSAHLNWLNPASLSVQDHVRISSQFLFQNLNIRDEASSFQTNYSNFNGFFAAFPVYRGVGISFGLQPVSKINYQFKNTETIETAQYTSSVKGLGGLNKLFLSTGFRIHPRISLGAGFGLVFGKSDETWRIVFGDSKFEDTFDQFRSNYHGITWNFGTIITIVPGWNVGGIYQAKYILKKDLDVKYFRPHINDTYNSEMEIPIQWGIGTSVHLKKRYLFAIDYLFQDWSSFSSDDLTLQANNYTQNQRIAFGFEYGLPVKIGMSYWQALRYRLGFVSEQPYFLDYSGHKLRTYFFTAGVGVPFASGAGALDFAFEFGKRGDKSTNTFEESIFRFSLNVSGGELWFQR